MDVRKNLYQVLVVTESVVERYLEYIEKVEHLAKSTVSNRRYILLPYFKELARPLEELTLIDVDNYFIRRASEIKTSSIGAERQAFRSFFRYCQEYLEMPMQFRWEVVRRKKDKPGRVRTFTREEVGEVVGLCDEMQDKLIISLLFETGMRISELLSLRVEDVSGTQIKVRGKGEENRVVFMSERLAEAIAHYGRSKGFVTGFLFRPLQSHKNHTNDRYISAYAVRDRIQRAFSRCGHKMHPHQLRHSFAVNWIMAGGDMRTLQILLGHSNIETTQYYLQFTDVQTQSIYHRVLTSSVLEMEK